MKLLEKIFGNTSTNTKDDYEEYIIVDTNNNYYIIEEYSVMDFKMKLDSYTIESQENIQKYMNESCIN